MSDSFFGSTTQQSTARTLDPTFASLFGTRQGVINQVLAGAIPSPEYINKIVIPSTMNNLTRAGLGSTGAVGEAVSQATLGAGLQLLETLLTGIHAPMGGGTTTGTRSPGLQDILGLAGGGLQGLGQFLGGIGGLGALGGAVGSGLGSLFDLFGGGSSGGRESPDILSLSGFGSGGSLDIFSPDALMGGLGSLSDLFGLI